MSPFPKTLISFKTKVLIPVVTIMVLLVLFTLWFINNRIRMRLEVDAADSLFTSQRALVSYSEIQAQQLVLRASLIPNDPRLKSVVQLRDANTLRVMLRDLVDELDADFMQFFTEQGEPFVTVKARQGIEVPETSLDSIEQGLELDRGIVEIVGESGRLFETVTFPIRLNDVLYGVLTMGQEITDSVAREVSELIGCDIVMLHGTRVASTSLHDPRHRRELEDLLATDAESLLPDDNGNPGLALEIAGDHFLRVHALFEAARGDPLPSYLILYNYQAEIQYLSEVQRTLAGVGLLGILLSSGIAWVVIGRLMRPLTDLQQSIEAVGRGDLRQRIPVVTRDEFGDFARAFNSMTENLLASRTELEKTVDALKEAQARLLQSEKLSAVGEFIAGVAHELNNPLTVMVGFTQLLEMSDLDEVYKKDIRQIAESSQRCHKIVQNLLSFARQRPPERGRVDVHELLDGTAQFLNYELRTSNIDVVKQYDAPIPHVDADPYQLQQVFLNIMNNARQAMEEAGIRGHIILRTASVGDRIRIDIQDNGPGIPPENLDKLFDPFFTTKELGKGTGLGLSVSYGIIKEHEGTIEVSSRAREATTFRIELPVSQCAPDDATGEEIAADESVPIEQEKKSVLVVDDEASILGLTSRILESWGYHVQTASDGREALQRIEDRRFDLVLCDWKMPGVNGQEFFLRLREKDPRAAARFIFMTGDVLNQRTSDFIESNGSTYLAKPFSVADFKSAVQALA